MAPGFAKEVLFGLMEAVASERRAQLALRQAAQRDAGSVREMELELLELQVRISAEQARASPPEDSSECVNCGECLPLADGVACEGARKHFLCLECAADMLVAECGVGGRYEASVDAGEAAARLRASAVSACGQLPCYMFPGDCECAALSVRTIHTVVRPTSTSTDDQHQHQH